MIKPKGEMRRRTTMTPGFDFAGSHRGPFARLVHPNGHETICTEWPGTLLALLKHGLLVGAALEEARRLKARGMEVMYL
jgi:hypothetical protein